MRTRRLVNTGGQGRYLTFDPELLHVDNFNILKATCPIETKFHEKLPGVEKAKTCSNHPGLMTMGPGPCVVKSFAAEPIDRIP